MNNPLYRGLRFSQKRDLICKTHTCTYLSYTQSTMNMDEALREMLKPVHKNNSVIQWYALGLHSNLSSSFGVNDVYEFFETAPMPMTSIKNQIVFYGFSWNYDEMASMPYSFYEVLLNFVKRQPGLIDMFPFNPNAHKFPQLTDKQRTAVWKLIIEMNKIIYRNRQSYVDRFCFDNRFRIYSTLPKPNPFDIFSVHELYLGEDNTIELKNQMVPADISMDYPKATLHLRYRMSQAKKEEKKRERDETNEEQIAAIRAAVRAEMAFEAKDDTDESEDDESSMVRARSWDEERKRLEKIANEAKEEAKAEAKRIKEKNGKRAKRE